MKININVIGLGFVGLTTALGFAFKKYKVICVEKNKERLNIIKKGRIPFYEPELEKILRKSKKNYCIFSDKPIINQDKINVIFICVGTPSKQSGQINLDQIKKLIIQINKQYKKEKIILVIKSTVLPGTIKENFSKLNNKNVSICSNPEFLREGFAVEDFMKPERVVVGTRSEKAKKLMEELYQPFVRQGNPILFMDKKSAELTKYASNSFLATKITFMNEIANYCEMIGADVDMVRKGMGTDSRIGKRFLFPGIGYGGSCFPKDVKALKKAGQIENYQFKIIDAVMKVNDLQKMSLVKKVKSYFGDDLNEKRFALWGLAFKPETDDIREAPSLSIIKELTDSGAEIVSYDPEAMDNVRDMLGGKIQYSKNSLDALKDADALLIATEWSAFRNPDFNLMHSLMKSPIIFDGRNLYALESMEKKNFYYQSVGRKVINNLNK